MQWTLKFTKIAVAANVFILQLLHNEAGKPYMEAQGMYLEN